MRGRKIAVVLGLIILFLILSFVILDQIPKESVQEPAGQAKEEGSEISLQEKQLIDTWIRENDLNEYGDIKDMVYIGGTPLFNETTSQSIDRYEYILQGHSDRPWKK